MGDYGKSPWSVKHLEDFLYYCCPECDNREHSKDSFLQHAFEQHPDAKDILSLLIGTDIKSEITEFIEYDNPIDQLNGAYCDTNLKYEQDADDESSYNFEAESGNYIENYDINLKSERKTDNLKFNESIQIDEGKDQTSLQCTKPNCNYQAKTNHGLRNHISHHKDCPFCEKSFYGQNAVRYFENHLKMHQRPKKPVTICDYCGRDFKFASSLIRHKPKCLKKPNLSGKIRNFGIPESHKNNENDPLQEEIRETFKIESSEIPAKFQMLQTSKSDPLKEEIGVQVKTEVDEVDGMMLRCPKPKCSFQSTNHKKFSAHYISHKECPHCDEIFFGPHSLQDYKAHIKTAHLEIKSFIYGPHSLHDYKTHIQTTHNHEGQKEHKCELCGKKFGSYALILHIRTVHEGRKDHKCETCGKEFGTLGALKVHIKTIHEGQKEKCEICGKQFTQLTYLKIHIKTVHEGQERAKNLICEFCSKAFTCKAKLKKHVSFTHTKDPSSHKCHICGDLFENLKQHISIVHEGNKNFECEKCGKCFSIKGLLKRHIKAVHEKSYTCDTCGKSFSSIAYLKHHISSVHDGEKKFECEHCGKLFAHREGMNCHIRTVHEGIRYQCDFCEKSFTQKPHLKSHLNEAHNQLKYLI